MFSEGTFVGFSMFMAVALLFPRQAVTQSLGGCRSGSEVGFAIVTAPTPILELNRRDVFSRAEPGDEFRLCRVTNDWAIVTLVQRGVGFRLAKAAIEVVRTLPEQRISQTERACIAEDINAIQSRTRGVNAQSRELIRYGHTAGVSLPRLMIIRDQSIRDRLPSCNR